MSKFGRTAAAIGGVFTALVLGSCVSTAESHAPGGVGAPSAVALTAAAASADPGSAVARAALSLVGQRRLRIGNREFPFDCSGTILAAHYAAGIDLTAAFQNERGNGVARLHSLAMRRGGVDSTTLRPRRYPLF